MDGFRSMQESVHQCTGIFYPNTLEVGIRQNRSRVVAYHTIPMARTGPFGEKATLAIYIQQTFLNFNVFIGIQQIEQGEKGSKSVPKSGIGIEIAGKYLSIVGAVMHKIAGSILLIEATGKKQTAIECGIECSALILRSSFHMYASEHLIPSFATGKSDPVETPPFDFRKISFGLLDTDKRRCHPDGNFLRIEATGCPCPCAFVCLAGICLKQDIGHRNIELQDEITGEVSRHTSAILARYAHYGVRIHDANLRTTGKGIKTKPSTGATFGIAGITYAKDSCTLGRSHLHACVVIGQIDTIIVWRRRLRFVREPRGLFVRKELLAPFSQSYGVVR